MRARAWPFTRTAIVASAVVLVAACALPPKHPAHAPLRDEVPLAGLQTAARDGWPDSKWWMVYADRQLDDLIERAMKQAPDLALAQSRLAGAEQSVRVAAAQAGLSVNGSAQVQRQRMSEHGLIPSQFLGFTWYNQADIGVQLQYDFDWWGKKRAAVESAVDQAHAAEAQQSAAALAIQYAVADTYFGWQADQSRLKLADDALRVQEQLAHIAELRVRQGVDLADEATKARAQLAAAREMRAAIEGSARIRLAALAALIGIAPGQLPTLEPHPLPTVAPGLPAQAGLDLIARRPDIAASRWQVEAALKKVDVARAAFLPDLSLSAMAGLSSIDLGKLFEPGSRVFDVGPALHLPIFNGGLLKANYGASKAQLDSAIAQYNRTVLDAARDVAAQALTAEMLARRRVQNDAQIDADTRLVTTATARERQGVRDAREALAARARLLQQKDAAAQLHAQAVSTDLSLIKALGGGYRMSIPSPSTQKSPSLSSSENAGAAPHEHP